MNFELNVDRSNFLLLSIASLFGLIVIVIAFYIYTSRNADTRQKYFKRNLPIWIVVLSSQPIPIIIAEYRENKTNEYKKTLM